jgi:hypothetical protein
MSDPVDFQGATPAGIPRRVVLGVVLVVIALGLAVAKPWDAALPASTPGPSAAAATPRATPPATAGAPAATPTPSPALDLADFEIPGQVPRDGQHWTGLHWIPMGAGAALTTFRSVTRWEGGWLALSQAGDALPIVWMSPDGLSWERVDAGTDTTFWPGTRIVAAAPLGAGLLAIGALQGDCGAVTCAADPAASLQLTAWTSLDGVTWEPVAGGLLDTAGLGADADVALTATSAGLVLAVTPHGGSGRTPSFLYTTVDGVAWRQVPLVRTPGLTVQTAWGDASAAYLAGSALVDGKTVAVIARSSDLRTWSLLRLAPTPGRPDPQTAWSILAGTRGLLAVGAGSDGAGTELWWRSRDGRAWSPVADYPPLGPTRCNDRFSNCGDAANGFVLGDGQRLLALQLGDAASAWVSSGDGQWSVLGTGDFGPVTQPSSVLLMPSGVVVVTPEGAWYGEATTADGG